MATTTAFDTAAVLTALTDVIDPELGVNIVDLGLIYDIAVAGPDVAITMTLTTPGCPLHESIAEAVQAVLEALLPGVGLVDVDLVWEPPWTPTRITAAGRRDLGWE